MRYVPASSIVLAALSLAAVALADPPKGPAKDVPELRILQHWIGAWDVEMNTKPNADMPMGRRAKGTATAEWTLDGRFIQQSATSTPVDGSLVMHSKTLMTYDPRKKVYRSWMFFSNGYVSESEGKWDDASRTMTSSSRDAESGNTTTINANFAEEGVENWKIVVKDRDGKLIGETTGKNVRRKQ